MYGFRKAILPIEAEMNDNSADDTSPHQSENSEETKQLCFQMKKIKEVIDSRAITNISNAQDRYKRDYDKKHHTSNVSMFVVTYS